MNAVDRCAKAAYQSVVSGAHGRPVEWEKLPEWWRKVYRGIAVAVINESMNDDTPELFVGTMNQLDALTIRRTE
jgi:hypothetical protein